MALLFIGSSTIGCGGPDSRSGAESTDEAGAAERLTVSDPSGVDAATKADTLIISGPATCGECRIEPYLVATVHDTTYPPGALTEYSLPLPALDGHFFVNNGSRLYYTDTAGAVVRQVGRPGEGPGEYDFPMYVWSNPTSYVIMDIGLKRLTRLRKGSLEVIATNPAPPRVGGAKPVLFEDGSLVATSTLRTRESIGRRFHLYSSSGTHIRSFGEGERPRHLAPSGDTAFWAGYHHDYRMELWSRDGELLQVLKREAEWFEPPTEAIEPGDKYYSFLRLHEDAEGLLWTYVNTFVEYEEGVLPPRKSNENAVEVIDPDQGVLVATLYVSNDDEYRISLPGGLHDMVRPSDSMIHAIFPVWGYRLRRGEVRVYR